MADGFEKFTYVGSSFSPKISIRSNGTIGISQGALHKFNLKEGEWYVVLFFNTEMNAIGIQPTRDRDAEGAIKLNKRQAGDTWISHIAAKSFLEYYNIKYGDKTRPYSGEWDESQSLIIVQLENKPKHKAMESEPENENNENDPF